MKLILERWSRRPLKITFKTPNPLIPDLLFHYLFYIYPISPRADWDKSLSFVSGCLWEIATYLTICHCKKQIDISFSCACPVIDHEFCQ